MVSKIFALAVLSIALLWSNALSQTSSVNQNLLVGFERDIARGQIAQVEPSLLAYASARPNDAKALELLARIRAIQGRLEEARALYQRVLALEPKSPSAAIDGARVSYSLGYTDDALRFLRGIESLSVPPPTRLKLAATYFFIGNLQKAEQLVGELPDKLKNGDALPLLGAIFLESGRREKINTLIGYMKSSSLTSPDLTMQNADILLKGGFGKEAAEIVRMSQSKFPRHPGLLLLLGQLEAEEGQLISADEHLKLAARLAPHSIEVLLAQAKVAGALQHVDEAFTAISKAREIAPDSPKVLADFVLLAIRMNKSQAALDTAKTLVNAHPDNDEFRYLLGAAALQNGNLEMAQTTLELYTKLHPTDSRGCLALGLTLAAQTDKVENARSQLAHCIEIDPSNYEAKYQLGLSYKAQGDNKRAIEFLEQAVTQAANYSPILRDLGTLYLQEGADVKARELLERAVSIDPQDADIHFQLARLYNRTGQTALAKQHLDIFQKLRNQKGKSSQ